MNTVPEFLSALADGVGGTIDEVGMYPDGESGFATMSFPLPKDHWIYTTTEDGFTPPAPWPMLVGGHTVVRAYLDEVLREGIRYGVKCATRCGREDDFDPDVIVSQARNGLLGVYTETGRSGSEEDQLLFDTPTPGSLSEVLLTAVALCLHDGVFDRATLENAISAENVDRKVGALRERWAAESRAEKRATFLRGEVSWSGIETDPDVADLYQARYPNGREQHYEDASNGPSV